MISVAEADEIIRTQKRDYGVAHIAFDQCMGRILAEDIIADRDLPPYDRVTMDGIAIRYEDYAAGIKEFPITGVQAAGDLPIEMTTSGSCIEIMTGAALPTSFDTVIRYEDVEIAEGQARITTNNIKSGQNIHRKGSDKKEGAILVPAGTIIDATVVNIAASVGKTVLQVKQLPRVVVVTTGDELVDVGEQPTDQQVRSSNSYVIKAGLEPYNIQASLLHITDDAKRLKEKIGTLLNEYDVIVLSGAVSKGKFDHLPTVLEELSVKQLFHGVQQRPGKPFWFGTHPGGALVFAFPGNPVSTFMCLHRYMLPWLKQCMGMKHVSKPYAILATEVNFKPDLQYFAQVKLACNEKGQLTATPVEGNGSGDFANLLAADAFMELPRGKDKFEAGEAYPVWPFKAFL